MRNHKSQSFAEFGSRLPNSILFKADKPSQVNHQGVYALWLDYAFPDGLNGDTVKKTAPSAQARPNE